MAVKQCISCGKERTMKSYDTTCDECRKLEIFQQLIKSGNVTNVVDEAILCPYCGKLVDNQRQPLDGDYYVRTCGHCNNIFSVNVNAKYYFLTKRIIKN